jgi:hypothetical protein
MKLTRQFGLRIIFSLVLFFLLLSQVFLVSEGWGGPLCVKTLTGPSEGDHPQYSWKKYGFPFTFLTVSSEGCFEEKRIQTELNLPSLILDFVIILLLILFVLHQWRLFRHTEATV